MWSCLCIGEIKRGLAAGLSKNAAHPGVGMEGQPLPDVQEQRAVMNKPSVRPGLGAFQLAKYQTLHGCEHAGLLLLLLLGLHARPARDKCEQESHAEALTQACIMGGTSLTWKEGHPPCTTIPRSPPPPHTHTRTHTPTPALLGVAHHALCCADKCVCVCVCVCARALEMAGLLLVFVSTKLEHTTRFLLSFFAASTAARLPLVAVGFAVGSAAAMDWRLCCSSCCCFISASAPAVLAWVFPFMAATWNFTAALISAAPVSSRSSAMCELSSVASNMPVALERLRLLLSSLNPDGGGLALPAGPDGPCGISRERTCKHWL